MEDRCAVKVVIRNRLGLHARPAMVFAELAGGFDCEVSIRRDDESVDGKSIMEIMMLAATEGTELEIITRGADAGKAIGELRGLVERGFDED